MNNKIVGYCVRCRVKRPIMNPKEVQLKGRGGTLKKAVRGICPVCGTTMFRILKKTEVVNEETNKTKEEINESIEKERVDFEKENQMK